MADGFRVDIKGAARMRRELKRAGLDLKDLSKINRKAATTVAAEAKPRSPIGAAKGGHIAATVRAGATTKAGIVRVGNASKPYAGPIHWGWPKRNIRPNPWVAEAAKSTENEWVDLYMQELQRLIGRIAND